MKDDTSHRLAQVLGILPKGLPATASGVEIRLLKKPRKSGYTLRRIKRNGSRSGAESVG